MLGIEKEILIRRKGKKSNQSDKFSISYISRLLDKSYMAIRKKLNQKSFSTDEALAIFNSIIPREKQTIDFFIYLFTEQN